jgi:hypothetical protein
MYIHHGLSCDHLSTVAVVGNQVGAASKVTSDAARGTEGLDAVGDSSGGVEVLDDLEVDSQTSNVRAGHGSTADGVGGRVRGIPRRGDVNTRSHDIDTSTCGAQRQYYVKIEYMERAMNRSW